jgi:hypothetical protein
MSLVPHNNTTPARQNNSLAPKNFFSMPTPQEMEQLINFCKVMASSPFYQKIGPGGVMALYLTAKELNLPFMSSLNGGMYTFDGKVTLSAQFMNMMIVNAGHRADVIELNEKTCKIRFWRCDRPKDNCTFEYEYNIQMAERAGYLKKQNWMSSPRDMLFSRCLSGGARKFMPDVLLSYYVQGEMGEEDGHIEPVLPALPASITPISEEKPAEAPKQIEHVKSEGYDAFCVKHAILPDSFGQNAKYAYVQETCKKANMSEIQVVNSAMKNEKVFEERFLKWQKAKYPDLDVDTPSGIEDIAM